MIDVSQRADFMKSIRSRHGLEEILDGLDRLKNMRVCVVGETIIDEYAYCNAMGKSGKEPMLVTRFVSCDQQGGGVLAIANNLAEFSDHVELVSSLGEVDSRRDFVDSCLKPGIKATFVSQRNAPTIVKRRYIDSYSLAKMFGVYQMSEEELQGEDENEFVAVLKSAISRCDLVVVADYGHGLITQKARDLLITMSPFLSVNTQLNAANTGYHTLSKYPHADFVCVHEGELRLDAREVHGDLRPLMVSKARKMGLEAMMVTLGNRGTILFKQKAGFFSCPSLANKVLERVGAGDAVLCLSSLAAAARLPPDVINLLGNLAGAQAVAVIGNRASIKKSQMLESIRLIMGRMPVDKAIRGRALGQNGG